MKWTHSQLDIYLCERVDHLWASHSKGHKTKLIWNKVSFNNVSEITAGRKEESWQTMLSLSLCWGQTERKANQQRLEGMSVFMYTSVSSLDRLTLTAEVCVCLWVHQRECVSGCKVHLPTFVCVVWVRQSAATFTASAGSTCVSRYHYQPTLISSAGGQRLKRSKPAFLHRSGSLVELDSENQSRIIFYIYWRVFSSLTLKDNSLQD